MNNRKPQRPNWFRIVVLCLLVLGGAYVNRYIIAPAPSPFLPTPTPTRAPEAYISEAEAYFKQGKLIPAIQSYKDAISVKPDDPAIHVALARVQVWAGEYEDAKTSAEDALLLNPDNSMANAVLGWALDFQKDYLNAESRIKRALELDPNNALAHAFYVEILVDSYLDGGGSFEGVNKAIDESKIAIALAPDTLETHRARGYILEATGNYEEAIREYQAAVAINANIADLHLALGRNYRTLGIYDQAVEEFTRANALNPDDPTPDYLTSRTYATIGEYGKAKQYAEAAVSNNPADTNLHGNLGVMDYRNLDWPNAVIELGYVVNGGVTPQGQRLDRIELVPDQRIAEYYFTYGLVLSRLSRCGEALPVAQMILARDPADDLAVGNANEIMTRCQQNLKLTPQLLGTPNGATTAPPSVTETATP